MSLDAVERVVSLVARASPRDARRVRRLLDRVDGAPDHVRPRLLRAVAVLEPALAPVVGRHEGPICPAYPGASPEIAARLALGASPVEVSGGLTAAEAHRWLSEAPWRTPAAWLAEHGGASDGDYALSSVAVARWLLAVLADPPRRDALLRRRSVQGPHGEEIVGSYAERMDELRDVDLRSSVEASFRAAGERLLRAAEKSLARPGEPLASAPHWWRPARCARLLLTGAQLVAEGRDMRHCVSTYAGYVRTNKSVVVSVMVRDAHGHLHRSTAELDRGDAAVRQHKGQENARPPALCQRALDVMSRRWQTAARARGVTV